jgi:hypothetical protein
VRGTVKITIVVLAAGAFTPGLTACGADRDAATDISGPPVVAASPVPHAEILTFVKNHLAKDEGLDLEVKESTDYVTPNTPNTATEDDSAVASFRRPHAARRTRGPLPEREGTPWCGCVLPCCMLGSSAGPEGSRRLRSGA